MKEEISKLLKLTFLFHFFVVVIFGLSFTFIVEIYAGFVAWPYLDPITGRVLGAVFLGFAAAMLLAWRETEWESVKIIVQMEIVWLAIGLAVHIWAILTEVFILMLWVQAGLLIFFLGAFIYFYYDQEWAK